MSPGTATVKLILLFACQSGAAQDKAYRLRECPESPTTWLPIAVETVYISQQFWRLLVMTEPRDEVCQWRRNDDNVCQRHNIEPLRILMRFVLYSLSFLSSKVTSLKTSRYLQRPRPSTWWNPSIRDEISGPILRKLSLFFLFVFRYLPHHILLDSIPPNTNPTRTTL